MKLRTTLITAALLAFGANAQDYKAGSVRIVHPHARATVAHQTTGSAYLTMENTGKAQDRLLGATSPIAGAVEMHSMTMDGNVMKMREVQDIKLDPGATIALEPAGGYHLMLVGLHQALKAGDKFPLTLSFEKAGKVQVSVLVDGKQADTTPSHHMH